MLGCIYAVSNPAPWFNAHKVGIGCRPEPHEGKVFEIEMQTICEITKIEMVQLHGVTAKAAHHFLPDYYRRIYVLNISENSELMSDQGIQYLDCQRDFILIDHQNPGQGKLINRKNWRYSLSFSWFLAGGLTAKNVTMMLAELQPNGVDVSSGVEIVRGEKDFSLIQEFINVVRGFHET